MSERVEMLAIGDELLDGRVTDTNAVRLGAALGEVGLHLARRTTVTDDVEVIVAAAHEIAARGTALCVVSGGLGPTADDLTALALGRAAGAELVRDPAQAAAIAAWLHGRGRGVAENQLRQADRPAGSTAVANPVGTAPGFALTIGGCRFVSVPGVPREFDAMVESAVVGPRRAGARPVLRRALYTFGLFEAEVDARVADLTERHRGVRRQFRVKFPEVHLTLHAPPEAEAALDAAAADARARLSPHVFAEQPMTMAAATLAALRRVGGRLAVAESCTGGLACDMLTDEPGSSAAFTGGLVAYDNALKSALLGVPAATLAEHGAVSLPAVEAMAAGVRERLGATHGIALSGIAGPGGGTPDKPVGTVFIAWAGPGGAGGSTRLALPHGRRGNKVVSATAALDLLRRALRPPAG